MNFMKTKKTSVITVLAVLIASILLVSMYKQAEGMMWGFDDFINLRNLTEVSSYSGLIDFIFGGTAGPGGRFLSLITFVANYDDWPGNPWGFAWTTLCLHICNALLVFLLSQKLFLREKSLACAAMPIAVLTACAWMLLPIHASGILLPVQRMTHVSAFFMLSTLYGYALIREQQTQIPSLAGMAVLSLWVFIGSGLAFFSKENGVTVITLVAIIEIFFFRDDNRSQEKNISIHSWQRKLWFTWIILAATGIAILLLLFLLRSWDGIQANYQYARDFSLAERLASQAVILWEYIRQTLIPRAALLGPYHDGHAIYSWGMWQPYFALFAWIGLLALGYKMYRTGASSGIRFTGKYLLFAIVWYMACHQVESTFIPLELYFEHRNYLAVLGIIFALAASAGYLVIHTPTSRKWAPALISLLAIYQIFPLQQITSLWGNPLLANEIWQINHPSSARAVQAVMNDLISFKFENAAFKLGDKFVQENGDLSVAIQLAALRCNHKEADANSQLESFNRARALIPHIRKPAGVTTGLASLGRSVRDGNCSSINLKDYKNFLTELLQNEKIQNYHKVRHHVLYELALVELKLEDIDAYTIHAQQSFFDFPAVSLGEAIALELFRAGRFQESKQWLETMIEKAPNNLIKESWEIRLHSLREALENISQIEDDSTDE